LIEAHASLSAWFYQMTDALRAAGIGVEAPSDAQRRRFVEQVAVHFPEIAEVAARIDVPRPYMPPPALSAPAEVRENEGVEVKPPPADLVSTPARVPALDGASPREGEAPPVSNQAPPAPPAIVDPSKVKYE
jgi:hypothetical protein